MKIAIIVLTFAFAGCSKPAPKPTTYRITTQCGPNAVNRAPMIGDDPNDRSLDCIPTQPPKLAVRPSDAGHNKLPLTIRVAGCGDSITFAPGANGYEYDPGQEGCLSKAAKPKRKPKTGLIRVTTASGIHAWGCPDYQTLIGQGLAYDSTGMPWIPEDDSRYRCAPWSTDRNPVPQYDKKIGQTVLNWEQTKLPGNEDVKPCGIDNHDNSCWDAKAPIYIDPAKVTSGITRNIYHAPSTDWPEVVSAHIVLDSVQAKEPGNEHVKPCGQTGPNETCWDASLRHIINHMYGISKERCENDEGVPCEELQPCVVDAHMTYEQCRRWVPIDKPVFEDKTPKPEPPLFVTGTTSTFDSAFVLTENKDPHGCTYGFKWDEAKGMCSINVMFEGVGKAVVTCSPAATDGAMENMICSYKPEPKPDQK